MTAAHARNESATNAAPRESALLLSEFPTLVSSEGGIARLRRLVLELAIQGRLSDAHSGDGSATPLYDEARRDRLARIEAGRARHMDELLDVSADESPWSLPSGWMWTRIGLAMNLVNGRAFKPSDWSTSGTPIIRIQNLNNPSASFNYCKFSVEPKFHLRAGDFLISWSGTPGTSFGAFIWNGPDGVLNQHIFRAEVYGKAYDLRFLRIAINARLDEMIAQAHGGVGLQHITKGKLEALPIPLPPLAEQKRIVAKVDQLMALCDELKAKQTKKRDIGDRLTKAALMALTSAETPEEFRRAWGRIADNFPALFDTASVIADLREALLDLAMKGLLVPQDPADGNAEPIVEALPSKKKVLTRKLAVRQAGAEEEPVVAGVPEDEQPHAIPPSWRWIRLSAIGCFMGGGTPSKANPQFWKGSIPWVSPKDMKRPFISDAEDHISSAALESSAAKLIPSPSLLMVLRGMILAHSFPVAITEREVAVNQDMRALVFADPNLAPFVLRACQASRARVLTRVERSSHGTCRLDSGVAESLPIPLPPLAEQRRIIARLDQLNLLCSDLEKWLLARESCAVSLAESLVRVNAAGGVQ